MLARILKDWRVTVSAHKSQSTFRTVRSIPDIGISSLTVGKVVTISALGSSAHLTIKLKFLPKKAEFSQ